LSGATRRRKSLMIGIWAGVSFPVLSGINSQPCAI
jgi:hypothetical protein